MIPKGELKKLFDRSKYEVTLFKEQGFHRQQCRSCGSYFWSLDPDRQVCGDTACTGGYIFLKKRSKLQKWDFHQTIKNWAGFFEKKGHTRIKDYPIVARWRDDIYFTIASIADFQPWVLNGTIDPPANSLVVPQPCVRFGGKGFCDIDNVGKTGRHLSLFIMGGQHSFNSQQRNIKGYWMDRCIELNYDFLVNVLKLGREKLSYREDVWQGGGNFGPSLEVFYDGLEVVNNVFMQYEIAPEGTYREMDFKVIDVGWGLERITWITQNTPTVYDAVFGDIIKNLKKKTNINIPDRILADYSVLSGLADRDGFSETEMPKEAKAALKKSFSSIEKSIESLQAIYAVVDHLRTLVFALADGAIPSNVGGGYNLRTLLRRVFALTKIYSLDIDPVEVCYDHIDFLKKTYPRVENARESVEDVIKIEKERYDTTVEKNRKYVESILQRNEKFDEARIREIYESRGIPPELIRKIAEELNKDVSIPSCFYVDISRKEVKEAPIKGEEDKLREYIKDLKPTLKDYYQDPYAQRFRAKVQSKLLDRFIILDRTLFYPLGGGQIGDTGSINGEKVIKSFKIGEVILHELEKPGKIREGDQVEGEIDWARRMQLMRNHTSAHIINGAARHVLGKHVWQAGAEKTAYKSRLDITHYKPITNEEMMEIERISNSIVMDNRKVRTHYLERNVAEEKYGFAIYQGGAVPGKILRIIEIEDWDAEACGGTHVDWTGKIGTIKIVNTERIQDGVVRIEYLSGNAAVEYIQNREKELVKIAKLLEVPLDQVYRSTEKFYKIAKELQKKIDKMQKTIIRSEDEIQKIGEAGSTGIYKLVLELESVKDLINIGAGLINRLQDAAVLLFGKNESLNIVLMFSPSVAKILNAGLIIKEELKSLGVKGGGKADLGQGVAPAGSDIEKISEAITALIKNKLSAKR